MATHSDLKTNSVNSKEANLFFPVVHHKLTEWR